MTVVTATPFGLETLKCGYEEWDVDALLAHYADDVEQVQIDREHPPSWPLVRRGKDVYRGAFEHCAAAGREGERRARRRRWPASGGDDHLRVPGERRAAGCRRRRRRCGPADARGPAVMRWAQTIASRSTRRSYRSAVLELREHGEITPATVATWRDGMQARGLGHATMRQRIAAVRALAAWAAPHGRAAARARRRPRRG